VKHYEGKQTGDKVSARNATNADEEEIGRLRKELTARENEVEVLKNQNERLSKEYANLSDQFSKQFPDDTPKKDR
jgi:predicted  nucleic acid-binding Zn-ribbon protein